MTLKEFFFLLFSGILPSLHEFCKWFEKVIILIAVDTIEIIWLEIFFSSLMLSFQMRSDTFTEYSSNRIIRETQWMHSIIILFYSIDNPGPMSKFILSFDCSFFFAYSIL